MKLLICQRPLLARFAFPNKRRFVLSPATEMAVEAVVRNVDLAADEPFCERLIPFKNGVPFAGPVQFFGPLCPESLGVGGSFFVESLIFFKVLNMRIGGELRRRRENARFAQD